MAFRPEIEPHVKKILRRYSQLSTSNLNLWEKKSSTNNPEKEQKKPIKEKPIDKPAEPPNRPLDPEFESDPEKITPDLPKWR
jgi:hypothetical protein